MIDIEKIKKEAILKIKAVKNLEELEIERVFYLGRKSGQITEILRSLKDLPAKEKRELGPQANRAKFEIENELKNVKEKIEKASNTLKIDITKPGKKAKRGYLHPLTIVEREIRNIFLSLNFSSIEGPQVETEYNNFEGLNFPKDHPAREMHDTFWLKRPKTDKAGNKLLLRTHTSPMQIRFMQKTQPPFQIIAPGKTFRNEATDASHESDFHQFEALMVGESVSVANFMFVVDEFFKKFFAKKDVKTRYRTGYFPFVEPGFEIDIKFGRSEKWMEVAGAGMVHRNVFKAVGYNPEKVSGFAFGFGLERMAMIKYEIPDIRLFHSGDLKFTEQNY